MNDSASIRNVNLLYLVAFVALLGGGLLLPDLSLGRRVVFNELCLLALPLALFLLLVVRDPRAARDALRLRGVSWPVAALSLLVGLGLWRFDWWLASTINEALDYTIPLPPESLNVTPLDKIAMAVGTVVLAPVVEELLFRGVLQSAYERRGPVRAIAATSLLFVAIHQELAQSVALIPVTLALGYVAWRTRSIIPAILVHLGNNGQAIIVSWLAEGNPRNVAFTPSTAGALVGTVIALAALWLLARSTAPPHRERQPAQRSWLGRNWPILPVVPIYGILLGIGLLVGMRPELLSLGRRVELTPGPWDEETHWRYEIRNALDERVGEAECTVTPGATSFVLDCSMEQSAYEADAPVGFFKEGEVAQRQTVRWDRETLELVEAQIAGDFSEGEERVSIDAIIGDGRMSVSADGAGDEKSELDLCYDLLGTSETEGALRPEDPCTLDGAFLAGGGVFSPLMVGEWPWRFSALPFELLYSAEATLLWPYRSAEGIDGRAPARQERFVVVRTAEQLSTPAGEFATWRVTVGEKYTAWYTVDAPHHLVAYDDDMVHWELTEVGPQP
jgi:membrane protease YdiL (CAAX protease family)